MLSRSPTNLTFAAALTMATLSCAVALAQEEPEQQAPAALSMSAAVEYGLEHNPELQAARREKTAAQNEVGFARRERVPRLDAVFAGRYESIPRAVIEMAPAGRYDQDRIFGKGIFTLDAVFTVPLYTGGRIPANIRRAELERDIADDFVARVADNLVYEIKRTYLTILQQDKTIEATQKSIEALTETQRIMREFREVGKVPSLDLYRVDSQLADVKADLAEEQAERRTLLAELRALLGWTASDGPELTGELSYEPVDINLQERLERALETNPAYAAAKRRVARQRQIVRIAEADLKPQLSLSGFGGTATSQTGPPIDRLGLRMMASQYLFDGGRQRAMVRAERQRLSKEEELLQQTGLDLTAEVETAINDAEDAAARVEALETALDEAREALRLEQLKYAQGKGLANDVLLAQAKLLDVEVGYYRALCDYGIALAALDRAVGRTTPQ